MVLGGGGVREVFIRRMGRELTGVLGVVVGEKRYLARFKGGFRK